MQSVAWGTNWLSRRRVMGVPNLRAGTESHLEIPSRTRRCPFNRWEAAWNTDSFRVKGPGKLIYGRGVCKEKADTRTGSQAPCGTGLTLLWCSGAIASKRGHRTIALEFARRTVREISPAERVLGRRTSSTNLRNWQTTKRICGE